MRDPKSDVDGWKPSRRHVLEAIGTATASGIAGTGDPCEWFSTPISPGARRQD